ncbi:hypothetical protein EW026_g2126 [Hermanssonia centrifuga]|uniref:Uncharacterized protein n=1 Tax=Hermanssonia centrifuga TaxID=98765 RepID=A0A4S4KP97_9APHY|nr:hypothetical protein EW026_g2126 [Hermanssonia centrifuga]
MSSVRPESPSSPKASAFYAIVLHDFHAERADELEAKAGDTITVVAQSNREWFVAKPIGRLGRPGLIPVSFVEIRDPSSGEPIVDVNAVIDSGSLPRVEDWKKSVMSYKANSISLGVLDDNDTPHTSSFTLAGNKLSSIKEPAVDLRGPSPQSYQHSQSPPDRAPTPNLLPEGIMLSADVKSFHFEMEEYWFRVHALYQPYGGDALPPAKQLVLFRSYNDFYDFQVELLDTFPREAGRCDDFERILPFMPGPAPHVDNEITVSRRQELDDYLHQLCELRHSVRYLLEHRLVRQFLSLKPGDAGVDVEPRVADIKALSKTSEPVDDAGYDYAVDQQLSRMSLSNAPDSGYEEGDIMGRGYDGDTYDYSSADYQREHSTTSMYKNQDDSHTSNPYSRPSSRTNSIVGRTDSYDHARSYSSLEIDPYRANGYSRSSLASSHDPSPARSSLSPSVASGTSTSGRSRSHSTANNPPISASIPQTAFIKIKILHEKKNDIVAIRVHPRVTHAQLMDKIQVRLGEDEVRLRYRESMSNDLVDLQSDADLRRWLEGSDRHMLIA